MKTIRYNKLVRDFIPEIIQNEQKSCTTSILDETQYIEELKKKLVEESQEVMDSKSKEGIVEELADVLEVIEAIQNIFGIQEADIQCAKAQKAQKNGRFAQRLFLHSVVEDK